MAHTSEHTFYGRGSGLGMVWYRYAGTDGACEVEYIARWHVEGASAGYYRSIFNGTDDDWQRQIVAGVNLLRRGDGKPVSQALCDAFNAWREAAHAEHCLHILAHPDRYGIVAADDPLLALPERVRGGVWEGGQTGGWRVTATA